MDYNNKLYKKIEDYVSGLFEQKDTTRLVFHDLNHTKSVVKHALEIAGNYQISESDLLTLYAAAWFHDTGHLFGEPKNHEEMSCEVMEKFMKENSDDASLIPAIKDCIMATKFPRNPKSLLQEIICDADTYHLGTKNFKDNNKRAWDEWQLRHDNADKNIFNEETVKMLASHKFYTSYCKDLLNKGKEKNLKKLKNKTVKAEEEQQSNVVTLAGIEKDKNGLMSKGIQTMLRLTSENHLKLSEMADHKANILISVNSIIISVILSVLLRKLQEDAYLTIPTIIFLVVAVTTIVIAIMATRPKVSGGDFTEEDIKQKKTNLLFFGNFYKATYEQYNAAMHEMMLDTDYLYGTLIKDIYYLGVVLGRKYKLIRLAYSIFMIGIIVAVLAFAVAAFFNDGSSGGTVINGSGSPL